MRSLTLRVTLLAAGVLAVSLALATVLAYGLLLASGNDNLDSSLKRERDRFQLVLSQERAQAGGRDDRATLRAAVDRYLQLDPGEETLSVVNVDGSRRVAEDGPAALKRLAAVGALPTGVSGALQTFGTSEGDVRLLTAQVPLSDGTIGATFSVAGSAAEVRDTALSSLRRLVAAGGVSLVIGSAVLAIALRTTLAPLRTVAAVARDTRFDTLDVRVPELRRADELAVLAREFNRMLDRLANESEARRQFLASVSHELRTPLTIARGHLELLNNLEDEDTESVRETTAVVGEELRHMGRLVDDLMTLAHSQRPGFLELRPVSVREFIDDLRLRVTGLDVPAVQLHEPEDELVLRADPDRLAQAVLNLIVNAHRHTPEGTPIDVNAGADGQWITLAVTDGGPGIDPAIREHMFEPFVTTGRIADPSGTAARPAGLGLAVVAAIVDAHHGTVDVDSGPSGTRVELRLPR